MSGGVSQDVDGVIITEDWASKHGEEQRLPGLDFSPQQMFWISAANVWCSKSRPEALKLSVVTGTHSPDQFRVQVEIWEGNTSSNSSFREHFQTWNDSPKILIVRLDQK